MPMLAFGLSDNSAAVEIRVWDAANAIVSALLMRALRIDTHSTRVRWKKNLGII